MQSTRLHARPQLQVCQNRLWAEFQTPPSKPSGTNLPNYPCNSFGHAELIIDSITSLSLGTIFAIATYQRNMPIMLASLPGRFVAAVIFYRNGGAWRQVAIYEASMGLITGAALLWDHYL
jgi:hypothetical protein